MNDDDHPLLVELTSLRETAARFQGVSQHEAHAAAIKLQRHSLDASRIYEHAAVLEQENARLTHEIDVLRAYHDAPNHPAVAQVQELSLALRRVSDKIVLTEDALLERTSELAHVRNELARARHTADGAYELAAHMRSREEASKARERELEFKARASEEERKMVDLVVQEYADLVRNLEGRKSASTSTSNGSATANSPVDTLQDSKFNLHRMLATFSTESETLHATIADLNAKARSLQMTLDSERLAATHDRTLLSQYKTELDKLNLEDQTAAKMVARYMKFSQASTNALQEQITTLKTRHASTIATLELKLSITQSQLTSERTRSARLRDALDELCEDLARESYGRRREVAIRLALLSREEGVAEFLRRWARRARELYARCYDSSQPVLSEVVVQESFCRVVADAESLLSTLDDDIQFSDGTRTSGAMARIALSKAAVDAMRSELQDEVQKRMEAVRRAASSLQNGHLDGNEDCERSEHSASPKGDGALDKPLPTPNGNARPEMPLIGLPLRRDANSPVSVVSSPEESIDDPVVISAPVAHPAVDMVEHALVQDMSSPSIQDSASTSVTLIVEEEPKGVSDSPAVSMLDLREDSQPSLAEEPLTRDVAPIRTLPSDTPIARAHDVTVISSTSAPAVLHVAPDSRSSFTSDVVPIDVSLNNTSIHDTSVVPEDDEAIPSTLMPTTLNPPSLTDVLPTLLSELETTKHRYDGLQRAFRDCSVALKELKRTLAPSSPSPRIQTKLRQHLETALGRIDDYAEDARVELEIRVADEELTVRGFEMMLSVPGALADVDERAELEAGARAWVDGTDEGVARALDKFGKKLEDVQHDVAVVKRAVHGLAEEDPEGEGEGEGAAGWKAWTAGLLGANASPSRSPTLVETFGAVMTSPRLRQAAPHESERGPLAGLGLRIPMPLAGTGTAGHAAWMGLGVGRTGEGERPRTLSAMYAVGGLRASSVGLGVGLGGSSSSGRARGVGIGSTSSLLRAGGTRNDSPATLEEANDFGGVE